jgi:hypothetical protein
MPAGGGLDHHEAEVQRDADGKGAIEGERAVVVYDCLLVHGGHATAGSRSV